MDGAGAFHPNVLMRSTAATRFSNVVFFFIGCSREMSIPSFWLDLD
jgi:hypothetical protein